MLHQTSERLLLSAVILSALLGCGHDPRMSLEGTVSLDGRPLEKGGIQFSPLPGTRGPTAGAEIASGKFAILPSGGPFAGNFRVEITAARPTGRKVRDFRSDALVDEYAQFLPARYNNQSELRAEITTNGPNHFEFALTSR